jgi:hypothetical protein
MVVALTAMVPFAEVGGLVVTALVGNAAGALELWDGAVIGADDVLADGALLVATGDATGSMLTILPVGTGEAIAGALVTVTGDATGVKVGAAAAADGAMVAATGDACGATLTIFNVGAIDGAPVAATVGDMTGANDPLVGGGVTATGAMVAATGDACGATLTIFDVGAIDGAPVAAAVGDMTGAKDPLVGEGVTATGAMAVATGVLLGMVGGEGVAATGEAAGGVLTKFEDGAEVTRTGEADGDMEAEGETTVGFLTTEGAGEGTELLGPFFDVLLLEGKGTEIKVNHGKG